MADQSDVNKAIELAFVAYERGKADGAKFVTPRFWEFSGHCSPATYFELRVCGQPNARSFRNILRQVELYESFIAEDEALEASSHPAESGPGDRPGNTAEGKGARDEPIPEDEPK